MIASNEMSCALGFSLNNRSRTAKSLSGEKFVIGTLHVSLIISLLVTL